MRSIFVAFCLGFILAHYCVDALVEGIFCGTKNCYDILGVPKDATLRDIKKAYRKLAVTWHPDKNRDSAAATEAFREIANAAEILSSAELRSSYDEFLENPERVMRAKYQFYRYTYAPKVDVRIVLFGCVAVISLLQYVFKHQHHERVMKYVRQDPRMQRKINDRVAELMAIEMPEYLKNKKKGSAAKKAEIEKRAEEELLNTVELVGGAAKPEIESLFAIQLFYVPHKIFKWILFNIRWILLFSIMKKDYDIEARVCLTKRTFGLSDSQWQSIEEERKLSLVLGEYWIPANKLRFQQEQAEKANQQYSGKIKQYRRQMKRETTG